MNDDEKKILKMANDNNFTDSENSGSDSESSYSENYDTESDVNESESSYSDNCIIEQETTIESNKIDNNPDNSEIEREISKKKIILNKKIIKLNMDKVGKFQDECKYDDWVTINLSDSDK